MRTLLAFAIVPALAGQITVEVASERIRAADLAPVAPVWAAADPALELARAPLPGAVRAASRSELALWARAVGLDPEPARQPEQVRFVRAVRRLERFEVETLVARATAERFGLEAGSVEVELLGFAAPLAPEGELETDVEILGDRLNEPTRVHLRWQPPGGRSTIEVLRATVRVRGEYWRARRELRPGEAIALGDLERVAGELPAAPAALFGPPVEGSKLVARRTIAAGEAVERAALDERPTVERGDLVELRLAGGAIRLRTPARVESAGSTGDVVACRNLESGRRITARVVSSDVVEALVR